MKTSLIAFLVAGLGTSFSGCGVKDAVDATKSMPGKMDTMISQTGVMGSGVHKQILVTSLDEMLKPENTQNVAIPTGMMPPGETFAGEATTEELMKLTYVWMKEINEVKPDSNQDGPWDKATVDSYDHSKLVKYMAIQVLAGLAPQSRIEDIVQTEINDGGRYEATAYQFLAARNAFTRDFLLNESLLSNQLTNPGMIDEAITRVSALDYLNQLPCAAKISLKVTGMLDKTANPDEEKVDPKLTIPMWKRLKHALDQELEQQYRNESSPERARVLNLRGRIRSGLQAHNLQLD